MITVTMFRRELCPVCDQAASDLDALRDAVPHRLVTVDVDQDPVLKNAYEGKEVPVIQVGPYKLRPPFNRQDLQVALQAAQERSQHMTQAGDAQYQDRVNRGSSVSGGDRFAYWMSAHYMVLFNLAVFLYVGLPFLAPALLKAGAQGPANVLYTIYKPLCHQLAFRSFFLFGEQAAYPRALAGVSGLLSYEQATGMDGNNFAQARAFEGDPQLGYKVALCERDVAIYGSILLFGMVFAATGKRFKSVPWYVWIAIGIIPIGLDGGTQLLHDLPLIGQMFPLRESTPFLRVATGTLFGVTTAWYLYPYVEEAMRDTRETLARKFAVNK